MNNNQVNFDPMTGQPINQNISTNNTVVPNQQQSENVQSLPTVKTTQQNTNITTQQQMKNIATVEQSKQDFINNTQANNVVKNDEKKDGPNIIFIIILFAIIFASIFFLFPYLLEIL